jgi:serine palmitoyltransferase
MKKSQCLTANVLITRLKSSPLALGATPKDLAKEWLAPPALKVCVTTGLSRKETEKAGTVIRHAVTSVLKGRRWQKGTAAVTAVGGGAVGAGGQGEGA